MFMSKLQTMTFSDCNISALSDEITDAEAMKQKRSKYFDGARYEG